MMIHMRPSGRYDRNWSDGLDRHTAGRRVPSRTTLRTPIMPAYRATSRMNLFAFRSQDFGRPYAKLAVAVQPPLFACRLHD